MTVSYDTIVVGGGIVGASAAYHLTLAGAKTLLIDRRDVGRATDAGAGILAPEMNRRDPDAWFEFAVPSWWIVWRTQTRARHPMHSAGCCW
jgi:D-amino-acid dehydrogenase